MCNLNVISRRRVLILLMLLPVMASAGVYSWTDDNGKVQFGDRPPLDREVASVTVRVNTYPAPTTTTAGVDRPAAARSKVVLYTTQRCGYCRKAKQFLTRRNISYTEYDIETSSKGKRDYKKLNGRGVPVILVGERRMNGYSETGLASMLKSAGYD